MKNYLVITYSLLLLWGCNTNTKKESSNEADKPIGTLEIVTEMDINPGNVAMSKDGRIFTTIHPMRATNLQLVEVTGKTSYSAFPDAQVQSTTNTKSDDKLDTPLGVIFDNNNRLWVIDAGINIGKTRLFAYNITTKEQLYRFDIPEDLAPNTSFVQDLAIDEKNGFAYLADFGNPGIIIVDIKNGSFRKFTDLKTMKSEDINMVIDGNVQHFMGSPARIGLNPITLSSNREMLYYGAMNGTKWYQIPTSPIRNGVNDEVLTKKIALAGKKPISDGAATDDLGNHYFTNLGNNSIDVLTKKGELKVLKKDTLLDWADNIRTHKNWLYIAVNQLHKTPAFTGGEDISKQPFRILRLKYK